MVSLLIENYLHQTESEKAERGLATYVEGEALAPRYEEEIANPAKAFRDCVVFVATDGGAPVGIVVVKPVDAQLEIKRLWVQPSHRGKSVASSLLRHVFSSTDVGSIRLTVWQWRVAALALYERLGFAKAESWEQRRELVCLERAHSNTDASR